MTTYVSEDFCPELRDAIRAELERLPDAYRRPVTLCYLEGMTHQEAAARLGWPVGTVKVRLFRGRRLLKDRLDRRGVSLGAAAFTFPAGSKKGTFRSRSTYRVDLAGNEACRR